MSVEKVGERPSVPLTSFVLLAQMSGCLVMPQKAWVEAEKAGESLSVPLMRIVSPLQVLRCSMTLRRIVLRPRRLERAFRCP